MSGFLSRYLSGPLLIGVGTHGDTWKGGAPTISWFLFFSFLFFGVRKIEVKVVAMVSGGKAHEWLGPSLAFVFCCCACCVMYCAIVFCSLALISSVLIPMESMTREGNETCIYAHSCKFELQLCA